MKPATQAIAWSANTSMLWPTIRAKSATPPTTNGGRASDTGPRDPDLTAATAQIVTSSRLATARLPANQGRSTIDGRARHEASAPRVLRTP